MRRVGLAVVLLLTLGLSPALLAQELASLAGLVTDKTGAVVPEVTVKLQDTRTNASYETATNSLGAYTFVKLLPGPGYRVVFSKDGFDTLTVSDIYIGVGSTHTQNAQLQLGKITQTVEVSGEGQVVSLDTTDTVVGKNFDMSNVHDLPIQARETPLALLDQLPGVVDTTADNDPNFSRAGAVTGSRTDQGNITLDGLDVNDFATGESYVAVGDAPVDSVQEFRVETANPLAASGRGSGAQVELVTKSGTNSWHGAAFDYLRNTVTEANTFFNDLNGIDKPRLIRNSFGANLGGPVLKNKLFFFFNYSGRRDAREDSVEAVVPLDSFRAGNVSYINNDPGCNFQSRVNTSPGCISTLSNAQIVAQGFDPANLGLSSSLLSFVNSRYPHANDLTQGDGVNTGGFRFNAPVGRTINDYVTRVDYNLSDKMKLFGRVSVLRDVNGDDVNNAAPIQFPGDPVTHTIEDTSYAYVIGHTWSISPTKVNQFFYGETRSQLNFPTKFDPPGTTYYSGFGPLTAPYSNPQSQHRIIPIPVLRDDFTYIRGTHNIQVGGTFKPIISNSTQVNDFNIATVGLGTNLTNLDSTLRPGNILNPDPILDPSGLANQQWDQSLVFGLGRFANISTNVNNDHNLQPLPLGTGHTRRYRYYETEVYLQDTWRMRADLTMTYGLRYQYYSVPYETNGLEASQSLSLSQFLSPRVQLGPQGITGPLPLVTYDLAGKANHGPGLYHPNWRDFAPRLAFSYNPSAKEGWLGRVMGDRKTVIRAGGGIVDDHTAINAVNFIQDQASYLFQNAGSTQPAGDLAADARFIDVNTLPPLDPLQPVTRPFTPFFIPGLGGIGAAEGQANYAIDPNLKTPYAITLTFGVQRELPANFMVEASYFGRLGRRLITQADAGQVIDFKDPTSGHFLAADFGDLSKQLRAGVDPQTQNVTPEPFFESQMGAGGTQLLAQELETLVRRGDLGDALSSLAFQFLIGNPGLAPGIGLHPQFGTAAYITNKGYSSYNGLLFSLHKKMSQGLQFDLNYTYSHSIDNISAPTSNVFGARNFSGGLICDVIDLSKCKGNSDFDVTHVVTTNAIWDLPVGRGKRFAATGPSWLNQVVGGWQLSLIQAWNSGFAFTSVSNAFPISFANNAPAVFNGDASAIRRNVHFDTATGTVQLFASQANALGAFRGPLGLEGGSRNNLRGPRFSNFDIGLAKHFPVRERLNVTFRADAFNAFNHPNFNLPGAGGSGGTTDITDPTQFGVITSTASPRQIQFSLRVEF